MSIRTNSLTPWNGVLAGFGFIGERAHLPALFSGRDDIRLSGIIDPCEARRRKAKLLLPDVPVFAGLEEFFDSPAAARVDFIDLCSPSALHAGQALRALERGYHVLSEKPLALDRASAEKLREAALRTGKTLYPVHNYRHAPVLKRVTELVRGGAIGALRRVSMEIHRPSHARGVPEWDPHWRRTLHWGGGGVSVDHGAHALYLICTWFNLLPLRAGGELKCFGPSIRGWEGTEEEAFIEATFPIGGMARIFLSWKSAARRIRISLLGESGAIFLDDSRLEVSRHAGPDTRPEVTQEEHESHWGDASHAEWLRGVGSEFLTAMESGDILPRQTEIALQLAGVHEELAMGRRTRPLMKDSPMKTAVTAVGQGAVVRRISEGSNGAVERKGVAS
jgi:predicted dehydrogenase